MFMGMEASCSWDVHGMFMGCSWDGQRLHVQGTKASSLVFFPLPCVSHTNSHLSSKPVQPTTQPLPLRLQSLRGGGRGGVRE